MVSFSFASSLALCCLFISAMMTGVWRYPSGRCDFWMSSTKRSIILPTSGSLFTAYTAVSASSHLYMSPSWNGGPWRFPFFSPAAIRKLFQPCPVSDFHVSHMLCTDVPLNTPKRSPQNPPVHLTALSGVDDTTAYLLLPVSVMPFFCAADGSTAIDSAAISPNPLRGMILCIIFFAICILGV